MMTILFSLLISDICQFALVFLKNIYNYYYYYYYSKIYIDIKIHSNLISKKLFLFTSSTYMIYIHPYSYNLINAE